MASARLKPRTNIAHVRGGTKRRSRAAHAVDRSGGYKHTNDSAKRNGSLPVFGTALLVLAAVSLALITGVRAELPGPSGQSKLSYDDRTSGTFTPVAFCPGYARGLAFAGRHAVIGLSRPRRNRTFEGLALDERLSAKDAVARCGLQSSEGATEADWAGGHF
jgi:hypothetical protein